MSLITQLFLSLQPRPNADMKEFFHFENQREPPSLAQHGSLRSGAKSNILQCIQAPSWGWYVDTKNVWQPLLATLSDASVSCAILLHCGCLKICVGRCKCKRAGVRCTTLCKCEGGCAYNHE